MATQVLKDHTDSSIIFYMNVNEPISEERELYSLSAKEFLMDCLGVNQLQNDVDKEIDALDARKLERLHNELIESLVNTERSVEMPGEESYVPFRYGSVQAHLRYVPVGYGFNLEGKQGHSKKIEFEEDGFIFLVDFLPLATTRRIEGYDSITMLLILNDTLELFHTIDDLLKDKPTWVNKTRYALNLTNQDMARFVTKRMGFNKVTDPNVKGVPLPISDGTENLVLVGIAYKDLKEKTPEIKRLLRDTLAMASARKGIHTIVDARRQAVKYILRTFED